MKKGWERAIMPADITTFRVLPDFAIKANLQPDETNFITWRTSKTNGTALARISTTAKCVPKSRREES